MVMYCRFYLPLRLDSHSNAIRCFIRIESVSSKRPVSPVLRKEPKRCFDTHPEFRRIARSSLTLLGKSSPKKCAT